jgi:symplekin
MSVGSSAALGGQFAELAKVKAAVQHDPALYPEVLRGVLPLAQMDNAPINCWVSVFLVDAFNCDDLDHDKKTELAIECLDAIQAMLSRNDTATLKYSVIAACSMYPILFSYVSSNPAESGLWAKMLQLKSSILSLWTEDNSRLGLEVACVKFAQQLISVQSFGSKNRDPRLMDHSDVSLASVPPGHPLIEPTLEAEALGLLDRLLNVFHEPVLSVQRLTSTIAVLNPLLRTREGTVQKVLRTLLSFDSTTKSTKSSNSMRAELDYKMVDKALKLLLDDLLNQHIVPKYSPQIRQYLATLTKARASEKLRKRVAEEDAQNKRHKVEQRTMPANVSTQLPPGPATYTSLYSLIGASDPLQSFDARELPLDIAVNIAIAGIASANQELLDNSFRIVRARFQELLTRAPAENVQSDHYPMDSYEDDDDVRQEGSDYEPGEDSDDAPKADYDEEYSANMMPSTDFKLPPPQKLSDENKVKELRRLADRLMSYGKYYQNSSDAAALTNQGLNRAAISKWDSSAGITLMSRMVTRGLCHSPKEQDALRQHLFNYAITDFRDKLEFIVSWLTEEWYFEYVEMKDKMPLSADSTYHKLAGNILEFVIPLLQLNDSKWFIRLLSDLPEVSEDNIHRIRSLCIDPDRAQLGFRALKFLVMFRPPVKEYCLDLCETLHKEDPDSRPSTGGLLKKYRPAFIESFESTSNGGVSGHNTSQNGPEQASVEPAAAL